MEVRELILKLCFLFGLLISFECCKARESEEVVVSTYFSNNWGSGHFMLYLKNNDDSFSIGYGSYHRHEPVTIYLTLKNEHKVVIKNIKLNDEELYFYNDEFSNRPLNEVKDIEYRLDVKNYTYKWKKLIEDAKGGDLKFRVTCMRVETDVDKTYEFRVSAKNLSLLAEMIDDYHLKFIR
ncbi:hypothetical protein bcCo53_001200 (plasmid) [Borrelia coriaceae]|uniref:Uncharacterized protein n=1 Tax=Borrelia coriaceae ATCC 43381 TaxID=1408429 RepID=W5T1F7_9SPIR|nr:hypothetical protein [Borrelia coriaceae]AHH11091.1 hypothetical protein BCO_0000802 [Borrelia coriaceae ATCC 43381]UPA17031.1 hypothetical protein bcCo53_001200 [Borrelia coriaceae]